MAPPAFPRVQAAAIDGRFDTVYHRQVQLEKLCKALIDSVDEIKQAIATDSGHTPAEIAVEYHAALSAIKRDYATLHPDEAHEQEYLIANGKNAPTRRTAAGVVYIEPTSHTRFYSAIAPLSASLAAGNTVIILLENNLQAVSGLLRRLVPAALAADAVAIASKPVSDDQLPENAIRVLQHSVEGMPRLNQLTSRSGALVVAVVDRTADLKLAARELVAARFSFGGQSPYAPDIILVNEFVQRDFLHVVDGELAQLNSNKTTGNNNKNVSASVDRVLNELGSSLRILSQQNPATTVVERPSRQNLLSAKLSAPIFATHTVTSLDDAIDLINTRSQGNTAPLLAAYYFCNPAAGKYLSQFISAEAALVNHIPRELLVGPAWPSGRPLDLITANRYPIDAVSVARPVHIVSQPSSRHMAKVLLATNRSSPLAQKLLAEATKPLKAFHRHPGGAVGFFEQGFLYSAGLIVAGALAASATGAFYLRRYLRTA